MSVYYRSLVLFCSFWLTPSSYAQTSLYGKIIDAATKEPIAGATIQCGKAGCHCGCQTNTAGEFNMHCSNCGHHTVTFVGYQPQDLAATGNNLLIELTAVASQLQSVVLTANRGEGAKRSEAPISIATISQ